MSSIERLARDLARVERRVRIVETQPQLAYSSIDDGAVRLYIDDILRGYVGQLPGGGAGTMPVNGPPPPQPTAPVVTPVQGGLLVRYDGTFVGGAVMPNDYTRAEVHVSKTTGFTANAFDTLVGSIESPRGGEVFIRCLDTDVRYVRLVARNTSGAASPQSEQTVATPLVEAAGDLPDITYAGAAPANPRINDYWILTPENVWHRWDGKTWVVITDPRIPDALSRSIAAAEAAAAAQTTATGAQTSANSKNRVYYQAAEPTGGTYIDGDIWYDTDDGYTMYVRAGTVWTKSLTGHQAIATLDMGKATVGDLKGERIAAQALSTRHLMVGSFDNLILDPSFSLLSLADGPHANGHSSASVLVDYFVPAAGVARTGTRVLRFRPANTAAAVAYSLNGSARTAAGTLRSTPATVGDRFHFEGHIRSAAAAAQRVELRISWRDAAGGEVGVAGSALVSPTDTGWTKVFVDTPAAPAGTVAAAFEIVLRAAPDGTFPTTEIYFEDAYARRMVDGSIVVDGSVSARKISTGVMIAGQTLIAGGHDANGVLLANGGRIEVSDAGVKLINRVEGVDKVNVHLNTATGSGYFRGDVDANTMTLSGTMTVSGVISGGTIRGGTFETAAEGARIRIAPGYWTDSRGIYGLRTDGAEALTIRMYDTSGTVVITGYGGGAVYRPGFTLEGASAKIEYQANTHSFMTENTTRMQLGTSGLAVVNDMRVGAGLNIGNAFTLGFDGAALGVAPTYGLKRSTTSSTALATVGFESMQVNGSTVRTLANHASEPAFAMRATITGGDMAASTWYQVGHSMTNSDVNFNPFENTGASHWTVDNGGWYLITARVNISGGASGDRHTVAIGVDNNGSAPTTLYARQDYPGHIGPQTVSVVVFISAGNGFAVFVNSSVAATLASHAANIPSDITAVYLGT